MATDEWVTGRVVLRLDGQPLEMEMTVPAKPVKPHRMLPVFQQMASAIVDLSVNAVEAAGEKVSCKAGCDACCYQPIPLAEIEVYQIAELVEAMPEPRRAQVKKRFASATAHFTKMNWFERVSELAALAMPNDPNYIEAEFLEEVMRYFHEWIPCPFLEDRSCSIYDAPPGLPRISRYVSRGELFESVRTEYRQSAVIDETVAVAAVCRPDREINALGVASADSCIGIRGAIS